MERKVKKSNPAQIAIDGAAYFIVIVSVLYVAYSSMGSGPGVAKEQVKVNPGWAAHTEVHQKPKPKSSWSLFADPAEVPQKTAEKQNSGAATWQFFGAEEEVQSTEQAKPVSETAIVSEVEEPVQTEQVFVEDQEEEVEVAPPVKRRVAAKATQPETENYWTLFAPDPAEDAVPRQKKQTPTFSFFAGPDEAEEVDSGKASEIIEKATEAFWDMFQVDKNLEKPFYKPSESVKSTKSKSRKDPNLMNHRSQESQQYVAQEEPLEPLDIPSNEVDESDNESNEHSSFFAEPDVQEKPVHNLQRDQNIDHDLFSSENMALFKKMLAFKNQDALPKIAENQGSWFAAEEPSKKQDSAIRKPSVQKSKYKQEQAWDQFFVEDIEESWLADETRPRKPQAPKNPSQNPSFSAPVPSKKVPSGGSSWFVEESEDSWLANKEQRVPKNPVVNQNPHISSAKPYQPKPAPMDNSIFVEDMEDSWLAEPKRQTEKTQDPKNDGTLKSASLKDLLTTGIYFSEPGVKPQNDQAKKQAFSKSPQVKTTKASSASDELFDSATIKKAYRFFDGFFKTEESSPVKERIQNIFVAEATQDAQAIYGNSEKEQKLSKKKV